MRWNAAEVLLLVGYIAVEIWHSRPYALGISICLAICVMLGIAVCLAFDLVRRLWGNHPKPRGFDVVFPLADRGESNE